MTTPEHLELVDRWLKARTGPKVSIDRETLGLVLEDARRFHTLAADVAALTEGGGCAGATPWLVDRLRRVLAEAGWSQ